MHLQLPQKSNSKTAKATGDLTSNKIADKITPQNISEAVTNETGNIEHDKKNT